MNFKNKTVIITGAGKGIGRSIACAYAALDANVVLAEKDVRLAEETCQLIATEKGLANFIATDVSRPEEIVHLMEETESRWGGIDILINNAGVSEWTSPYELSIDDWDRIININLRGIFLCAREAAKVMRKKQRGSIVNISSTRALMSEPNSEAYAASKGGIVALTHALAASLAPDHIQVNCISPGWIETGEYNQLRTVDHKQHFSQRVGVPNDIARACLYLTDEGNHFVNGTNLIIDGGMTKKMIYES
jgi:NAD(P)-dependent dehydrogenase (short-subunit alcohol dehydrogenase family)